MAAPINPNTAPARRARKAKRRRAAGSLDDLRDVLWGCVERVEALTEGSDAATTLRAAHALAQTAAAYLRVIEVGELEARLAEVEARTTEAARRMPLAAPGVPYSPADPASA